jgi:hypothetical protein
MLKKILGAIAGYIATFIFIFATFSGAYLAMGADTAFTPGKYDVSMTWIIVSTILGFVGAVIGGYVASLIGGSGAVKIMAGIVLVLGILTIVMVALSPAMIDVRTADVPNLEAMSKAQTPLWLAVLNPIIGIVGVLVGGRFRKDAGA